MNATTVSQSLAFQLDFVCSMAELNQTQRILKSDFSSSDRPCCGLSKECPADKAIKSHGCCCKDLNSSVSKCVSLNQQRVQAAKNKDHEELKKVAKNIKEVRMVMLSIAQQKVNNAIQN